MSAMHFTSKGVPINIGTEIGHGGEGAVFEVPACSGQVAKLYYKNKLPDRKKQEKLLFMVESIDQELLNYVAWPQETLHPSKGGVVVGFLMQKVTGRDPVHMVYSPKHRKQEKPKATWEFLLFVARNTAAAFCAVHSHGHVVGDVNHGNVLVGSDSKVVLIDSDSFQISANGTQHLCEVGVSHFTPPELQGISSFHGFSRTANNDNFGLALLIFHLLFGGRHPFSGVSKKRGVGEALESDIKAFCYAYARDSYSRGLAPPPGSIPVSMVPDSIEAMFHLAFTEKGATGVRPTSRQWVTALDDLRKHVKRCAVSAMHVYPDHLLKCPWCALEPQGVIYFIDIGAAYGGSSSGFVLTRVWALIESIPEPPSVIMPRLDGFTFTPRPLPENVPGEAAITLYRIIVVCIAVAIFIGAPKFSFLGVLAGIVGWIMASFAGAAERNAERARRTAAKDDAQKAYNSLVEQAKTGAGHDEFRGKKANFAMLRDEYKAIPQTETKAIDMLYSTARERQKQKYLDTCFIDSATIPGVGPGRKAALRSFGIETAADVTSSKVRQVRGFGDSLTRAMMDWKASRERLFTFNPNSAISDADKTAVRRKFSARRVEIENALNGGAGELQRVRQAATSRLGQLQPKLDHAARQLAQAQKDLSLL